MIFDVLIEELHKVYHRFLSLVFIFLLLIGLYMTYDSLYLYWQASRDKVEGYKPEKIDEDSLKEISKDAVAWIHFDKTSIDYPIMQGKDNITYLNKNPFGEYSLSGSIFVDYRNSPDFSDSYNLIYGHHMSSGLMFGALDYFKQKKYFYSHRTGTLKTKDTTYHLYAIGILITDANVDEVFLPTSIDNKQRISVMKKQALLWDDNQQGELLSLTTCKEPSSTARTALICRIKKGP